MSDLALEKPGLPNSGNTRPTATAPWRRWSRAFDFHNFSTNTAFTSAIWIIYLAKHGYSPLELGLLEMLFHVAKFVMEVPTGIFADLLGRRKSLLVYCAVPYSTVYLWTLLALAAGALGILLLVLCLRAWHHTRIH